WAQAERLRMITSTTPMASSSRPSAPPPMARQIPPTPAKIAPIETGGPTSTGPSSQVMVTSPATSAVHDSSEYQTAPTEVMVLVWLAPGPTEGPSISQSG